MTATSNTASSNTNVGLFSARKFGVEIECVNLSLDQARNAIRGAGVVLTPTQSYTHEVTPGWKVVTDSSLVHNSNACEVVSPILSGEEGIEQIRKVAAALSAAGATINRSCGLHVHVCAADLSVGVVKMVVRRYEQFQANIDAFMPQSRRDNDYARKMASLVSNNDFKNAPSKDRLANSDRYFAINLAALGKYGTLEFRQHSGSVNGNKIENWVRFCVSFVEQSKLLATQRPEPKKKTITRAQYNKLMLRHVAGKIFFAMTPGGNAAFASFVNYLKRERWCPSEFATEAFVLKAFAYLKTTGAGKIVKITKAMRKESYTDRSAPENAYKLLVTDRNNAKIVADRDILLPEAPVATPPVVPDLPTRTRDGQNLARLFHMMRDMSMPVSPTYCPYPLLRQIARAFGWTEATTRSQLSKLKTTYGVIIKHGRNTNSYRYLGQKPAFDIPARPANVPTYGYVAPVQPEARRHAHTVAAVTNDALWNGISPSVQSFYTERASELATNAPANT